jgi:hypothetical protein
MLNNKAMLCISLIALNGSFFEIFKSIKLPMFIYAMFYYREAPRLAAKSLMKNGFGNYSKPKLKE